MTARLVDNESPGSSGPSFWWRRSWPFGRSINGPSPRCLMMRASSDLRFGFRLAESAKKRGVDFVHEGPTFDSKLDHIMPQVASTGAAVAVADFDRDGWQDFYVTNSREGSLNRLYRNQGRRHLQGRRRISRSCGREPLRDRRVDGRGLGRLRQRRLGGSLPLSLRPARSCFVTTAGRRFVAVGHGVAALGERERSDLAGLRPRRTTRSVSRRLLAGRCRSLEARRRRASCRRASSTPTTAGASTCCAIAATERSRT